MLLELSFPEPDSQIAMLLPVIVACSTPWPLLIGCGVHRLCGCVRKRRLQSRDADERTSIGEQIELRRRGLKQ
ncbi:Protein Y71G10AR.1, partial [Aphelenchoides avenae]